MFKSRPWRTSAETYAGPHPQMCAKFLTLPAWKRVKANGGAGGIDKISIDDVKAYGANKLLAEISETLNSHTYRPQPVRRTYIPKSDGSKRPLGIPIITCKRQLKTDPLGVRMFSWTVLRNQPQVSSVLQGTHRSE